MKQTFFQRRSFHIFVVMFFLMPLILAGTRRALLSNVNDVKEWLPDGYPETATHRWFQAHFPHEQFVLVSWEGCTLEDTRLELLAQKLERKQPPPDETADRPSEEPREVPLRKPAAEPLGEPWFFKSVYTGQRLVSELEGRYEDLDRQEVLTRLEGSLIGKDHSKTCLVVTLSEEAKGKKLRDALEKIRDLARECNIEPEKEKLTGNVFGRGAEAFGQIVGEMVFGRPPPGEGVRMGGPPVDNVAIDVEGERTLFRLAGLSAVIGLGISFWCFRSWRLTGMVFTLALLSAGIGLAMVYFTGSTVDAILLSMPSLVYVLAMSGAVHIINYYHDAVRENGLLGAPETAIAHGWKPCTIAAITTALGMFSLCTSELIPINKFGFYSGLGVLATLGLLFLWLPANLHYMPSRDYVPGGPKSHQGESKFVGVWRVVGGFVVRHNRKVALGCTAAMILFMVGLARIEFSVKLMKLFSDDAPIIYDYGWLEEHLGPLVPMEVVIRVDNRKCKLNFLQRMRMARDVENAIEENLDDVGGALSAATFAPKLGITPPNPKVRFGWNIRESSSARVMERYRKEFRDYLMVDMDVVAPELEKNGRNPTLEELGITGPAAEVLAYNELGSFRAILEYCEGESIKDKLKTLRGESGEALGPDGAGEPAATIDRWCVKNGYGEELWRVSARVWALTDLDYSVFVHEIRDTVEKALDDVYRRPVDENGKPIEGLAGVEGVEVTYTGMVPLVYKAQHELMNGLIRSLALAFVLIAFVMMFVLKSVRAGLLAMIPNLFPVAMIFGMMGWLGILVDVGTMMTASVALGVAVDDTIHYLTWYRHGLDIGKDRKGAAMLAYERCATAMSQTTLIGGLGLAAFAFSTFTPTQRFGVLMLALLFAALIGDLIFLPALLSSPIGRFFKGKRPQGPPESPLSGAVLPGETAGEIVAASGDGDRDRPRTRHDAQHRSTKAW